jgi:hypothetical protein
LTHLCTRHTHVCIGTTLSEDRDLKRFDSVEVMTLAEFRA